jgi:hypothetical protein
LGARHWSFLNYATPEWPRDKKSGLSKHTITFTLEGRYIPYITLWTTL